MVVVRSLDFELDSAKASKFVVVTTPKSEKIATDRKKIFFNNYTQM